MGLTFNIVDAEGGILSASTLDKQACAFWGIIPHKTQYASPKPDSLNWFDTIGWGVASCTVIGYKGWDAVKIALWRI